MIKRAFAYMLAWPLTGQPPPALREGSPTRRRGPVPTGPDLAAAETAHVFEHLRSVAERSLAGREPDAPEALLLRRQAYYLLAWNPAPEIQDWLGHVDEIEQRHNGDLTTWSPSWAAARSLRVARARLGDPEPLRHFIRHAIESDQCQAASLNYWAYWIGETPLTHHADDFMAADLSGWRGGALIKMLHNSLRPDEFDLDLDVHSLWALIQRRPGLVEADLSLTRSMQQRAAALLDAAQLSNQSRTELEGIRFALRLIISSAPRRADHRPLRDPSA